MKKYRLKKKKSLPSTAYDSNVMLTKMNEGCGLLNLEQVSQLFFLVHFNLYILIYWVPCTSVHSILEWQQLAFCSPRLHFSACAAFASLSVSDTSISETSPTPISQPSSSKRDKGTVQLVSGFHFNLWILQKHTDSRIHCAAWNQLLGTNLIWRYSISSFLLVP